MRSPALAIALLMATPAFAHHEVVVATSMLPFVGGVVTIAVAGFAALSRKYKKRISAHHAKPWAWAASSLFRKRKRSA